MVHKSDRDTFCDWVSERQGDAGPNPPGKAVATSVTPAQLRPKISGLHWACANGPARIALLDNAAARLAGTLLADNSLRLA
jgi:hypothetical protein